jgi:hypothetical protein
VRLHRRAGYLVVGLGLVIVLAGLAVPPPVGPGMIFLVAPAGMLGLATLVRLSGRHADG